MHTTTGLRLLLIVVLATAAMVGPLPPALATMPGDNGQIVLWRQFNGLFTLDADGGNAQLIADADRSQPAWSPDGSRIAYSKHSAPNQIWTMAADGSDQQLVTAHGSFVRDPVWSPDGTKIAFVSDGAACGDNLQFDSWAVWVVEVASGATTKISADLHAFNTTWCRFFDQGLTWSPDGATVVTPTSDNAEFLAAYEAGQNVSFSVDLVAIDVDSHTEQNLTWQVGDAFYMHSYPSFSPDGSRIVSAYADQSGVEGLYVVNGGGGGGALFHDTPNREYMPRWSPDGSALAYLDLGTTGDIRGVYRVNADGSNRQLMFPVGDDTVGFDWQPLPASDDITLTSCTDPALATLTTVAGNLSIDLPPSCTNLSLPVLDTVGGSIDLSGNGYLATVQVPELDAVGGSVDISCSGNLAAVQMPTLDTIGGDIDLSNNGSISSATFPELDVVAGSIDINLNSNLSDLDLGAVGDIGGYVDISGNGVMASISAPTLTTVTGDVDLSGNGTVATYDFPLLQTVGGDMDLSADATVTTIDCTTGLPTSTTTNGSIASISVPSLTTVGGDLDLQTQQGDMDVSAVDVGGDLSLAGTGDVTALTPGGATDVELSSGPASMQVLLAADTFTAPVQFSIDTLASLPAEDGLAATGSAAEIQPLAAYLFSFAVPTLGQPASLAFELELAELAALQHTAVLDAITTGALTIVVKGDDEGDVYEAFPLCGAGESPAADACVTLQLLDADRQAVEAAADAAIVRLEGAAGHFSTWALATVTDAPPPPPPLEVAVTQGANGAEGAPIPVQATVSNASLAAELAWTATPAGDLDPGASCTFADATAASTSMTCNDDGSWTTRLTVTDGTASGYDETTVNVTNGDPTITLDAPAAGNDQAAGQPVSVAATVGDPGANDVVSCSIDWGDGTVTQPTVSGDVCADSHSYATPATPTITVTATDDDGGTTQSTRAITVTAATGDLQFEGFFAPVNNDTLNIAKSGATVPIKFRVRDASGALVTDTAVVASASGVRATCEAGASTDPLEQYATGATSLRYDTAAQYFIYNWKSPFGKAGACYQVVLVLSDDTEHSASFKLK